jgi:predicted DNA binding CopG/RHH family protein
MKVKMKYIDKEEKDLIESYNKGEWHSTKKKNKKVFVEAAKASVTKSKRINIRLTSKDFYDIQAKALEEGVPYQTLISSIIHKYNKGKLRPIIS